MITRSSYWLGVTIACALVSACSQAPQRTGPKFSGRLLFLSGGGTTGGDLLELTPDGAGYKFTTIAGGISEASGSPDQKQLLYATKDGIMLRDLQGGTAKSLIKGAGFCLGWAPDGKHFTYAQKSGASSVALYVSDVEGKIQRIAEDSNAIAEKEGDKPAALCAQWLAPDRLVYDRFSGEISRLAAAKNSLKPNTSTVGTISNSVRAGVTFERKWSIQGVCPTGSAILTPADQSSPILIAKSVDRFETVNPTPGPSEGRFIGFAAKSCVPFFISQSLSNSTDLFSLNPTNWQRLRTTTISYTFSPNAKFLIKSSAKLMVVGDAPDKLLLIDTESGEVTSLTGAGGKSLVSPVPIIWIEN